MYAPDTYELLSGAGEKDSLKKVEMFKPEIILILPSILQGDLMGGVELVKKLKELHPQAAVFVNLGVVDDEDEVIDAYMACGAYKCYTAPVIMDTLFHDMFVALNLE